MAEIPQWAGETALGTACVVLLFSLKEAFRALQLSNQEREILPCRRVSLWMAPSLVRQGNIPSLLTESIGDPPVWESELYCAQVAFQKYV